MPEASASDYARGAKAEESSTLKVVYSCFLYYILFMSVKKLEINTEILAVKNIILKTVDCEKIYLFGSHANNAQQEGSDYDLYVVLKNESENPVFAEQNIYRNLSKREGRHTPIDVLAENKNKFNALCVLPTIDRKIVREGVLLYDASFSEIFEQCIDINPYKEG